VFGKDFGFLGREDSENRRCSENMLFVISATMMGCHPRWFDVLSVQNLYIRFVLGYEKEESDILVKNV